MQLIVIYKMEGFFIYLSVRFTVFNWMYCTLLFKTILSQFTKKLNIDNTRTFFLSRKSVYFWYLFFWFLKDHVTLETGKKLLHRNKLHALENSYLLENLNTRPICKLTWTWWSGTEGWRDLRRGDGGVKIGERDEMRKIWWGREKRVTL